MAVDLSGCNYALRYCPTCVDSNEGVVIQKKIKHEDLYSDWLVALQCPTCSYSWFVCTWCMTCRSYMDAGTVRKHYIKFHREDQEKRRYKRKREEERDDKMESTKGERE